MGIGLFLFVTKIRFPVVIATTVSGFGDMIGMISMLAVGMLIGAMDLREVFAAKRAYFVCLLRLLLLPGLWRYALPWRYAAGHIRKQSIS